MYVCMFTKYRVVWRFDFITVTCMIPRACRLSLSLFIYMCYRYMYICL